MGTNSYFLFQNHFHRIPGQVMTSLEEFYTFIIIIIIIIIVSSRSCILNVRSTNT
jgi:hypothetical protein